MHDVHKSLRLQQGALTSFMLHTERYMRDSMQCRGPLSVKGLFQGLAQRQAKHA